MRESASRKKRDLSLYPVYYAAVVSRSPAGSLKGIPPVWEWDPVLIAIW